MKVRNIEHVDGPSWKIVGLLISLAMAAIIIGVAAPLISPDVTASQPGSAGEAIVRVSSGEDIVLDASVSVAASSTVFDALRLAAELQNVELGYRAYPGMGVLVTGIGGRKNGEGGAYWQYWLNGSYAEVAADLAPVRAGDRVEWKFSSSIQ